MVSVFIVRVKTEKHNMVVNISEQKNLALNHIENSVAKYFTPNLRSELRARDEFKRTISCREPGCKFYAYVTLIGKVHKFKGMTKIILPLESYWLI